jgi:copper homeostasis protein
MPQNILLEICLDSVESAVAAQQGGAHRVELCSNLDVGGTTPSFSLIEEVRKLISIKLHVMVRPRGGDFCYSAQEFELMKNDILRTKQLGADGVVFGILTKEKTIDSERCRRLVEIAKPMSTTFHRAYDEVTEPFYALEDIVACGVDRLLTSGQKVSATEGIELIALLVQKAGNRIAIMPGAGIHAGNINNIIAMTGVTEIHIGTAATKQQVVDKDLVRKLLKSISS